MVIVIVTAIAIAIAIVIVIVVVIFVVIVNIIINNWTHVNKRCTSLVYNYLYSSLLVLHNWNSYTSHGLRNYKLNGYGCGYKHDFALGVVKPATTGNL